MSALLEQIQQGAESIKTAVDVTELGGGGKRTPPGRWKGKISDIFVCMNKRGDDLNLITEVTITEGPAVGAKIRDQGPYPAVDTQDPNYRKRAWKIRQVLTSVASVSGGKEKIKALKEKGVLNLGLTMVGKDDIFGNKYEVTALKGKEVCVETTMEPSKKDPTKSYSAISQFITVEEYDAAPGQAEDFTVNQPGNQVKTAAPVVNGTVETNVNLAPVNGATPVAQAASAVDDLIDV